MRNKKVISIVYPENYKIMLKNNFLLCELFINELISLEFNSIKIGVNNKMRLIECNDFKIKKILDLILRAGKLDNFRMQMLELIHKEQCLKNNVLGKLIFFIDNQQVQYNLIIKETQKGIDFTWDILKGTVSI